MTKSLFNNKAIGGRWSERVFSAAGNNGNNSSNSDGNNNDHDNDYTAAEMATATATVIPGFAFDSMKPSETRLLYVATSPSKRQR